MKTLAGIILLLIIACCASQAQTVESGWKGILPLLSNETEVEEAYGKPDRIDDNGYFNYRLDDSFVQINYSSSPCLPNHYNRGKFNVPSNTVLDITVGIKKVVLLRDLAYDRPKYYRDTSGDVANYVSYRSQELGISIGTAILDEKGNEYVGSIRYSPSEELKTKFKCK